MANPGSDDLLGITTAVIKRIEPYGLYLHERNRTILVLIVDISRERIPDLAQRFQVGQIVKVNVLRFVPEGGMFKGSMLDMPDSAA
jgi:ribosomal protein S1